MGDFIQEGNRGGKGVGGVREGRGMLELSTHPIRAAHIQRHRYLMISLHQRASFPIVLLLFVYMKDSSMYHGTIYFVIINSHSASLLQKKPKLVWCLKCKRFSVKSGRVGDQAKMCD